MKTKILASILAVVCATSFTAVTALADGVSPDKFEAESYTDWYDATPEDIDDTNFPESANRDALKVENGGTGKQVAGTGHKNWLKFENLDFDTGYNQFYTNYSAKAGRCSTSARLEVRLDDVNAEAVCTLDTPATSQDNWANYQTVYADIETPITGVHDVYVYMLGEPDDANDHTCIGNFDYFGFVKAPEITPASITLNSSELSLNVGKTATLTATVAPDNATDKSVEWLTSNPAAATVENGVVTAVAEGTSIVTAKTVNGLTASCTVTVTKAQNNNNNNKPSNGKNNTPANGVSTVNGKTVVYKNSKQVTGTKVVTVSGKTYAVVKGYVKTGSKNQLVKIGKKSYIVNKKGIVVKGKANKLVKVGKKSYIVNKKGVVLKNKKSVKVGKKLYMINKKGVAQRIKIAVNH